MIERINIFARRKQKEARNQALEMALKHAEYLQQSIELKYPASEASKSAVKALQSIEDDNDWSAMRSFLKTKSTGTLLFGNKKEAERIKAIRDRL